MITYEKFTQRNVGIIRDQDCLKQATIAIGGCGGAGGEVAVTLARMGVGRIRIADPDTFDVSNSNRQYGASTKTLGQNKAEVIAASIRDINPFCQVEVFTEGITEENVETFLNGASIALEEIDFTKPYYTALFHRAARKLGISVMTALPVGWTAFFFFFVPDGMTYEEYVGLNPGSAIDEFKSHANPITAYCPEPLEYIDPELVQAVAENKVDIPAVAPSVNLTAGLLASLLYLHLSGEIDLKPIPWYYSTADMFNLLPKKNTFIQSDT